MSLLQPSVAHTLDEAIEIALNAGVEFDPEDYFFQVLPDEKFDEFHGEGKFAVYGLQARATGVERIGWKDLCRTDKKMPVSVRASVFKSDQAIVAIFAHECFEVEALREKLSKRKTISATDFRRLTGAASKNNYHWSVWRYANEIVVKNFGESV